MKRILMILFCTFLLFGCSMKTKTESKVSQAVAIVGVTAVDTIIYSTDQDKSLIKSITKGFDAKKSQNAQMDTSDLKLTIINDSGKKENFEVNYKQSIYSYKGDVYKLDSNITKLLEEQFMN